MRSTHARSSSSERALASESIGSSCVTFVRLDDRLAADALRGRVGRAQLGVLGLDGRAARRAARRSRRRRSRGRRGRSTGSRGGGAARAAPRLASRRAAAATPLPPPRAPGAARDRGAPSASIPSTSSRSKCSGRHRDVAGGDGGEIRARLLVVAGDRAVHPVAPPGVALLVDELELVAEDALAEPADLDAVGVGGRGVDVQERALGHRHALQLLHDARDEPRALVERELVGRAGSPSPWPRTAGRARSPAGRAGCPPARRRPCRSR